MTEQEKVNLANEYFETLAVDHEHSLVILTQLMNIIEKEVKSPSAQTIAVMMLIMAKVSVLVDRAAKRVEIRKKLGEQPTPKGATIN